jgi:hypothetical protein
MSLRQRPAPVTVVAYLNIIFGILWLLLLFCAGSMALIFVGMVRGAMNENASAQRDREVQLMREMMDHMFNAILTNIPFFGEFVLARAITWLVLTLLLLVSGIGLLGLRPWARRMCIVYALMSLILELGSLVYSITVVNPGMERFTQDMHEWMITQMPPGQPIPPPPPPRDPVIDAVVSVISSVVFMIYPVIVLILMLLPGVSAAFTSRGEQDSQPPPVRDDDYFGPERPY